jgi:hypothetical protein
MSYAALLVIRSESSPQIMQRELPERALRRTVPFVNEKASRMGGESVPATR